MESKNKYPFQTYTVGGMSSLQEGGALTGNFDPLEHLGCADSSIVDDLLGDLQPPSGVCQAAACAPVSFPMAGHLLNHNGVVELSDTPRQEAPPFKFQAEFQLPSQAYPTEAGLHSCISEEKLTLEEIQTLAEFNAPPLKVEDSLLYTFVPLGVAPTTAQLSEVSGDAVITSGSASDPAMGSHIGDNAKATPSPQCDMIQNSKQQGTSNQSNRDLVDAKREAQRRYRVRSRQKAQDKREQLENSVRQAQAELEALNLEQASLHTQNTVLQSMVEYKESLLASARNAIGKFTAASSTVYSFLGELQTVMWNNLVKASDDQIMAISKSEATILSLNRVFFKLLSISIIEWGSASPAERPQIERNLGFILGVRYRAVSHAWKKNPLPTSRTLHCPPVDPSNLADFARAKSCVKEQELVAAAALTEDQKVALMKYWNDYLDKYNTARKILGKSAVNLEESIALAQTGAVNNEPVGSMSGAANAFVSVAETIAELEYFNSEELIARAHLTMGAWSILRPLQQVVLLFDVTPQIDIVKIYKTLLKLDYNIEHSKSAKHTLEAYRKAALLCQC
jgi:hypothetical protein